MKKLSIEQKAKLYDEALERMKAWVKGEYPEYFTEAQKTAEFIFPELKESKDERIRKAIVEFFELQDDNTTYSFIPKKDILTWLEKQGEQKLAWNEKDEGYMDRILDALYDYYPKSYAQSIYDWLKFLKKSVKGE